MSTDKTSPQWRCRRCGNRVIPWAKGWKHASAGQHRRTPEHMRHAPEPVTNAEYEALFGITDADREALALSLRRVARSSATE